MALSLKISVFTLCMLGNADRAAHDDGPSDNVRISVSPMHLKQIHKYQLLGQAQAGGGASLEDEVLDAKEDAEAEANFKLVTPRGVVPGGEAAATDSPETNPSQASSTPDTPPASSPHATPEAKAEQGAAKATQAAQGAKTAAAQVQVAKEQEKAAKEQEKAAQGAEATAQAAIRTEKEKAQHGEKQAEAGAIEAAHLKQTTADAAAVANTKADKAAKAKDVAAKAVAEAATQERNAQGTVSTIPGPSG